MNLPTDEKIQLIVKNIAECIGIEDIKEKIENKQRLKAYWGTEPTRSPSLGYFIPMLKLRDLLLADCYVVILLADVHAMLNKGTEEFLLIDKRVRYYQFILTEMLQRIGVKKNMFEFVRGRDIQLDRAYIMDLLRMMTNTTISQAKKAGATVVKQDKDPKLSSIVYPLMQVIDEIALEADIQLGGIDQRKIFAMSRDVSHYKCAYIMNDLLCSLRKPNEKMSSSQPGGKIELFDSKDVIREKINKAYCIEYDTNIEQSPCLQIIKYIIFPIIGRLKEYNSFDLLLFDWEHKKIYANELKEWIVDAIDDIISPIRRAISDNQDLYNEAFPG